MQYPNAYYALLARLRLVVNTASGFPVKGLSIEPDEAGNPKLIRGVILTDGVNGMRQDACTWLPSGRHRLYEKLNITIPEPSNPLT